jgi:hypothetical protein
MGYYWEQNKIYILLSIAFFIAWIILIGIMVIDIQIDLASINNEACDNPIAIYFDKESREKCLHLAAEKKLAIVQKITDTFDKNVDAVVKKTKDVKREIKAVDNYYNEIQNKREQERNSKLDNAKKMYDDVYNLVNTIRVGYKENQDGLVKLVDFYQNTFEYNQKIMAELASQLLKKLVANTFTKKYETQRGNMVSSYDKIRKFLTAFSKESIPELPNDARKGRK